MGQNPRQERIRQIERQTCGRRMYELGPWEYKENLDWWEYGRWARTQEEADTEVAHFLSQHPDGSITTVHWQYPGPYPRTCSFCGGVHPDDAIALLDAGWRSVSTDKTYKRYLEPPGHLEHLNALIEQRVVRQTGAEVEPLPRPQYASPVPPVKLYVQHFSLDQIERYNAALLRRRHAGGI